MTLVNKLFFDKAMNNPVLVCYHELEYRDSHVYHNGPIRHDNPMPFDHDENLEPVA